MVICAELPTELNERPPIVSKEFFKSINYRRDDVVADANNNSFFVSPRDLVTTTAGNRIDGTFDVNRYNIKAFYRNANILLTGGTGFIGKVLLEKLLRSCDNVCHIYVLLRSKRGLSSEQRYKELIQNPVFDRIRENHPERLQKIVFVAGDISKPNIGLNHSDLQMLKENVNIVFHSAATVRFDQGIKEAVNLNTLGSKRLWDLCVEMHNLKSIIHVSTAYTNPTRNNVGEAVYPPRLEMDNETFMKCVEVLPDDLVMKIATELQGKHPNTYTITKSMTEQLAVDYHHKLPISIIRPSIVTCSLAEPFPGWVDNINGITGIIMEIGRGTISSIMCDNQLTLDVIPVDIVCNMIITAAWHNYYKPTNSIRVYNCTSGRLNTLKWETCRRKVLKYSRKYPSKYVMMYPNFTYRKNRFMHTIYEIFLHFLPAYLYDWFMRSQGMKPMMMKIAKRYKAAADTGEFFAMHEWDFDVNNVNELLDEISATDDQHDFNCDVKHLDWDTYLKNYVFGIRKYVLKDDLSSMDAARKMVSRLYIVKWTLQIIFFGLIGCIFYKLFF